MPGPSIPIDTNPDEYKGFCSDEKVKKEQVRIGELALGTKLEDCTIRLFLSWDAASSVRALPYLMIHGMTHMARIGRTDAVKLRKATWRKFLSKIRQWLKEQDCPLDYVQRRKLDRGLENYAMDLDSALDEVPVEVSMEQLWDNFTNGDAAINTLFHSQQIVLSHLYFSYESFVHVATEAGAGTKPQREIEKKLSLLATVLGLKLDELRAKIYDNEIELYALLRHAIAHNGGRITEDLKRHSRYKTLEVIDHGLIFISPGMVTRAHKRLLSAVAWLIESAAAHASYAADK